jgi:hypothetical protein
MDSLILNALGFHIENGTLVPPDIWNEQERVRIQLGLEQIKLVEQRLEGKREYV